MKGEKSYTVTEAKRKLESFCVYQDRCHKEVRQKLIEMRMISESIDEICRHLIEHNFLNETRFAQSFARGKFRIKKWGKIRITRQLKQFEIGDYNIKKGLQEIEESDYMEAFNSLFESLLNKYDGCSKQIKKKKIYNALSYRGWENELIFSSLNEL